jgi:hypothetical protein
VFKTARLVRGVGKEDVAHAELTLSSSGSLSIAELEQAFGAFRTLPRVHPNQPLRVLFSLDDSKMSHTCAIIAEVQPGDRGLDDGHVTGVTVRRDIRLS